MKAAHVLPTIFFAVASCAATPKTDATPATRAEATSKSERDRLLHEAMSKFENQTPGSSGFGAAKQGGGRMRTAEFFAYQNKLAKAVKAGWRWSGADKTLHATVTLHLERDGNVTEVGIDKASGDEDFDRSVVATVRRASPLPPPPEDLYREFANIKFTFYPE